MEKPFISIIVPVYNIKELLPRCVASVCTQTYPNFEVILVDDGSTDGSGKLCDEFARNDARIRAFHKENGGSSSARNLGIKNAKGEYLGFVDSDDYIEPDMYEKLVDIILEKKVKAAQIGRDEIAESGERLPDICIPPAEITCYSAETFMRDLLLHKGDSSFCTKLVAKELFSEEQFPEGVLNEDFYLLVKMLPAMGCIYSLPGYGYHVYYRMGSNTRKTGPEAFSRAFSDGVDNADKVLEIVREKYPALEKIAVRFGLFQRLDYLLHIPMSKMRRNNVQYRNCVSFIRKHLGTVFTSKHLTKKNKIYLVLFAIAPKGIRRVHRFMMRKRGLI